MIFHSSWQSANLDYRKKLFIVELLGYTIHMTEDKEAIQYCCTNLLVRAEIIEVGEYLERHGTEHISQRRTDDRHGIENSCIKR